MLKVSKLAALAAIASLLAACGGHGGGAAIPSTPASSMTSPGGNAFAQVQSFATSGGATNAMLLDTGVVSPVLRPKGYRAPISVMGPQPINGVSARSLKYMGGKIQPSQKIYLIFWGKLWNSTGDPNKIAPILKSFFGGLNGSQWESTMTQYYGPTGTFITNTATLAGSWVDTGHQPALHPTDSAIGAEAKVGAAHFGDYSVNASYVVVMPHGHNPSAFNGGQYCAYHNSESATGGTIAYTNLPYIPDAGTGCGAGSVNSPGTDDGVSIVAGHEEAETNTDPIVNPNPTGWYNSTYGEIGDECAWVNLKNTTFSTGTFPTQPLWSNSNNACVQ